MDAVQPLSVSFVVCLGAVLCVVAQLAAVKRYRNLLQLFGLSCLAELGVVLVGFGAGSSAGISGAYLHLMYQTVTRVLALCALLVLAQKAKSFELAKLRGIFSVHPFMAGVFAFAMFAALGITPFKGAVSRLAILHGAFESGHYLSAALVLAGCIAAISYTLRIVQALCFEKSESWKVSDASRSSFDKAACYGAGVLACGVALMHMFPEGLLHIAEGLGDGQALPHFESPWPLAAIVPYLGGFVLLGISRFVPKEFRGIRVRETVAVALSVLTVLCVFAADAALPLSSLFAKIMACVGLAVTLYSVSYMEGKEHTDRYWFFLMLMQGSLVGLCLAHDFGTLYGFWELMTLTSYFLVIHEQSDEALEAGYKYFFMCASGAYVMLFGLLFLHAQTGSFEFATLSTLASALSPGVAALILVTSFVGFWVKAGLMPLHSWLPAAHPVAPSSISAPLSGILTKTGIYGFLLLGFAIMGVETFRGAGDGWNIGAILSFVGAVTMLFAEVMALLQRNVKRMLAYSTMAQIGEICIVLGVGSYLSVVGGLAHVVNHAMMKNLLFLGIGIVVMRAGTLEIQGLKGLGRKMPVTGICLMIAALSIVGLPPFGGFVSKFMLVYACLNAGHLLLAAVILTGGLIAALYYMRLVKVLFFEAYEGTDTVKDAPLLCQIPMVAFAALIVLFGIAPQVLLGLVTPVADALVMGEKLVAQPVPAFDFAWPFFALVPMLGAVVPYLLRHDLEKCGLGAVGVLAVSFVAVLCSWSGLSTVSLCFALLITMMGILNTVYSVSYMEHSHTQWRFFTFLLLMIGGLLGVAGSEDLFSFFMFWELMSSWTLYFVIIHEETAASLREGFKYFVFNMIGATFMFFGIVLLTASGQSFEIGALAQTLSQLPGWVGTSSMALIALGFVMKAAMLPVRIDVWMHPATAPTPVSGYISSVLLKSGPFGLLKLFFVLGGAGFFAGKSGIWGQQAIMYTLAWVAGITIFYAAAMAVIQSGLKRMLIYSTVSQLGYVVLGICAGSALTVSAGMLHFVSHMLFKNLAFLCAGAIMFRTHADSLNQVSGLARKMPVTFVTLAIAAFSAIGVPPFSGFTSKWMLYHGLVSQNEVLLALLSLTGSVLTMAYFIKFLHSAFFGYPTEAIKDVQEVGPYMRWPMMILAGACCVFGVFPGLLLAPINSMIAGFGFAPLDISLGGVATGAGSWNATETAILLAVAYGAARFVMHFMSRKERVCEIHTCGVSDIDARELNVQADNLYEPFISLLREWIALPKTFLANRKG